MTLSLITGGAGFIGSNLVDTLLKNGHEVVAVDNEYSDAHDQFYWNENSYNVNCDVRNYQALKNCMWDVDYVFHLAAQAIVSESYLKPLDTFTTNTLGSLNILEAIRTSLKKCNIVMITSDKVYENVEWLYGYRERDSLGGKDPYSASKSFINYPMI